MPIQNPKAKRSIARGANSVRKSRMAGPSMRRSARNVVRSNARNTGRKYR